MSAASPRRYWLKPFSNSVNRNLRGIHPTHRRRILEAVETLADNPRPAGARQLRPNLYRIRVGDYRIIYYVNDSELWVEITRIEHRGETTYRDVHRLF